MTNADLSYDRTTPEYEGLASDVTVTATGELLGSIQVIRTPSFRGRPGVLRWQPFEVNGAVAGPIWVDRNSAADCLLPETLAARKAAQ